MSRIVSTIEKEKRASEENNFQMSKLAATVTVVESSPFFCRC